ncbi:hypothetical protein PPYR_06414 [Photinus pyralis]|uniref:Cuticle protein 6 n=1 Tax=Photinus pyralis TaxID=7054 RepID=A0A1Y1KXT0_PHOPY|nr:uncharacterized protein LOC116166638 [Photinus pyralis]KAB0800675.1 hypothetical protein PPYR_06414 [Photinus pyralis]
MRFRSGLFLVVASLTFAASQKSGTYVNPSILQDSRNLPQTDGTFGFLYRTEDGIAHAAVGEPGGQVHGRFTYTDPTGLKVNYNYNAGTKTAPGLNYEQNQPERPQPNQNSNDGYYTAKSNSRVQPRQRTYVQEEYSEE